MDGASARAAMNGADIIVDLMVKQGGDGSFLKTPHALLTAVEHGIPVVWVVWNNEGYASIRDIQMGMFGGRELATSFATERDGRLFSADFAVLARSMGVDAHRVARAEGGGGRDRRRHRRGAALPGGGAGGP